MFGIEDEEDEEYAGDEEESEELFGEVHTTHRITNSNGVSKLKCSEDLARQLCGMPHSGGPLCRMSPMPSTKPFSSR